jgi:hypothetical protein
MTQEELKRRVVQQDTGDLLKYAQERAVHYYLEEGGKPEEAAVSKCRRLAEQLARFYRERDWEQEQKAHSSDRDKGGLRLIGGREAEPILSQITAEKLRPWVQEVRQEIFGHAGPPFATDKEAMSWLSEVGITLDNAQARLLYQASHEMAEVTGFDWLSVRQHILTGETPMLFALTWAKKTAEHRLHDGRLLKRTWAVIDVRDPHLINAHVFRRLYDQLRRVFRVTKMKALKASDEYLLQLVKQLGGPPPLGKGAAFWREVQRKANEQNRPNELRNLSSKALEKRYMRLKKKLQKMTE